MSTKYYLYEDSSTDLTVLPRDVTPVLYDSPDFYNILCVINQGFPPMPFFAEKEDNGWVIKHLDLSANLVDLSANVLDLSANVLDLSANVLDLSANVLDLSANVLDLSANVLDLSANVLDLSANVVNLNE